MALKSRIISFLAKQRARKLAKECRDPWQWQQKTFGDLISQGKKTRFGQEHQFETIQSIADFQKQVPVKDYEGNKPYFDAMLGGEPSVLWPGKPTYLAKTSGTTSGAKYIPITSVSIKRQIASARDALFLYAAETGDASFFDGKMLFLSGSPEVDTLENGLKVGRLSGIVNHFVPGWLTRNRVPSYPTNCIEDWETKVKSIIAEVKDEDLRLISGIPPWVQMFFEELVRQTGKQPLEVWPNLSIFVQGGVDFSPYAPVFAPYLSDKVKIVEVFPASEGFFAFQDAQSDDGLLLLPNNGIFYEFIPIEFYGKPDAPRLTLQEVEIDKQYALIITTNAGLWAYDIGDTVKFTSVSPYKLRVTGRVKHFISAFGEHVIVEEVNRAMNEVTGALGTQVQEFTVAPFILPEKGASHHQWLVEFSEPPKDIDQFSRLLDESLQRQNSYYADLREGNMLDRAQIIPLPLYASRAYMKSQGKLGGQNKFPRLTNDRTLADALLALDLKE